MLQCVAVCCGEMRCSVLPCVAVCVGVCCGALKCVAVCCSTVAIEQILETFL